MTRTLEQRIKFDSGLTIGQHHIKVMRADKATFHAIADIGPQGSVKLMLRFADIAQSAAWVTLRGDILDFPKRAIVSLCGREFVRQDLQALFSVAPTLIEV